MESVKPDLSAISHAMQGLLKEQTAQLQPNMVDKNGTKWYIDPAGSQYASMVDQYGITLGDGASVWAIEELNGQMKICLVLTSMKTGVPVQFVAFEHYTVQAIGHEIDRLRAMLRAGKNIFA